jgi:hypothetical protein
VLQSTGGITDHIEDIIRIVKKDTGAIVRYSADPIALLNELEEVYTTTVLPRYLRALDGHDPDGMLER